MTTKLSQVNINGETLVAADVSRWFAKDTHSETISTATLTLNPSAKSTLTSELQFAQPVDLFDGYASATETQRMDGFITKIEDTPTKIVVHVSDALIKAQWADVNKVYVAATDSTAGIISEIVKDLLTISGIDFDSSTIQDSTSVQGGILLSEYRCKDTDPLERMMFLANGIGWWLYYRSDTNKAYFHAPGFETNTNTLYVGGVNNNVVNRPVWTFDGTNLFNELKIEGALDLFEQPAQLFSPDGGTDDFVLTGKNAEFVKVEYDAAGGTSYTVQTGGKKGSSDSFDYTFVQETNTVTFQVTPNSGTNSIRVTPTVGEPTPVELDDPTSKEKFGQTIKKKLTFTDVKLVADAELRAQKLLDVYSDEFMSAPLRIRPAQVEALGLRAAQTIPLVESFNTKVGTRTMVIRSITRHYPEKNLTVEVGDRDFRTLDLDFDMMIRLKRLEEESAGDQEVLTTIKRPTFTMTPVVSSLETAQYYVADSLHASHKYNGLVNHGAELDSFEGDPTSDWTGSGVTLTELDQTVLDGDLVVYYTFEGGVATDQTSNNNDGTVTNVKFPVDVIHDRLADFDGASGDINAGSDASLDNLTNISVLAVIRPGSDGEGNAGRVVQKGTSGTAFWHFNVEAETGGNMGLGLFVNHTGTNLSYTTTAVIPTDEFTVVGFAYDGGNFDAQIFVGNSPATLDTSTDGSVGRTDDSTGDLTVGNSLAGDRTFDGEEGKIKVWDRELSDLEWLMEAIGGSIHKDKMLGFTWASAAEHTITSTQSFGDLSAHTHRNLLGFNATTTKVVVADTAVIQDVWDGGATFSCFFNANSDGENDFGTLVEKNHWTIRLKDEAGGLMNLEWSIDNVTTNGIWTTTSKAIPINTWVHVALVFDSTISDPQPAPTLYVQGVAVAMTETQTPSGARNTDAGDDLVFGNRAASDRTFDGEIRGAGLFSRGLRASEVSDLMNDPLSMAKFLADDRIVYYDLNEGSGSTATDLNGVNDGTITDAVWSTNTDPLRGTIGVWMVTPNATDVSAFVLRIGSGASDYHEYNGVIDNSSINRDDLTFTPLAGKNLVLFYLDSPDDTQGTPDWSDIDYTQLRITTATSAGVGLLDLLSISPGNFISFTPFSKSFRNRIITKTVTRNNF